MELPPFLCGVHASSREQDVSSGMAGGISGGRIPPRPNQQADPLRIGAETRSALMAKQVTVISPLLH